jgi:hypothetical protein
MRIGRVVSAVFFGFIFSACGCLFSFIFGQDTTLTCQRVETTQVECLKESKWLGQVSMSEASIQGLEGAWVAESCDEDGCTYRVEMDTADGRVPLTSYYSSGARSKHETADRINAFLRNPAEGSLTVKSGAGLLGLLLPFVFVAVGPIVAFSGLVRAIRGRPW